MNNQTMQMMDDTDMMSGPGMDGMMGLGWVWMILCVGFVIALSVWLVRRLSPVDRQPPGADARRLLDERYARGEIDSSEYVERRDAFAR